MKNYRLTPKGIKSIVCICVIVAVLIGFFVSFVVFSFISRGRIYANIPHITEQIAVEDQQNKTTDSLPNVHEEETNFDTKFEPYTIDAEKLPVIILFEKDSSCLGSTEYEKLEAFADFALNRDRREIRVSGHAAYSDDEEGGEVLSYLRARAVYEYLVYCGIQEERIKIEAHGYHKPGDTENVRSYKNMRVELSFGKEDDGEQ